MLRFLNAGFILIGLAPLDHDEAMFKSYFSVILKDKIAYKWTNLVHYQV